MDSNSLRQHSIKQYISSVFWLLSIFAEWNSQLKLLILWSPSLLFYDSMKSFPKTPTLIYLLLGKEPQEVSENTTFRIAEISWRPQCSHWMLLLRDVCLFDGHLTQNKSKAKKRIKTKASQLLNSTEIEIIRLEAAYTLQWNVNKSNELPIVTKWRWWSDNRLAYPCSPSNSIQSKATKKYTKKV